VRVLAGSTGGIQSAGGIQSTVKGEDGRESSSRPAKDTQLWSTVKGEDQCESTIPLIAV
jgi:hypothetical protein